MATIMDFDRKSLGNLFEAGDAICCYHDPELIERIVYEAKLYNYRSICTSTNWLEMYRKLLEGTNIKLIGMVAYPYGDMSVECKKVEIKIAIEKGCDALDIVMNISYLKSGMWDEFKNEVFELVNYAKSLKPDIEVKPLIEVCLLNNEQLTFATEVVRDSGAEFFKTQTGWFPVGLTLDQLKLMRKVAPDMGIKACGAITESIEGIAAVIEAGANIIGGNGIRIVEGLEFYQDYLRRNGQ